MQACCCLWHAKRIENPAGQQADVGIGTKGTGPRAGYEEERKIEIDQGVVRAG